MKTAKRKIGAGKGEPSALALGPGMHLASVELASGTMFRVRTTAGRTAIASLGEGVARELAEACLREGKRVVVADGPTGPEIVGALMTELPVTRDRDGRVELAGKEVRVRAERAIVLEVGDATLSADDRGVFRLEGDRMVIDMGALVKILSTRVELP